MGAQSKHTVCFECVVQLHVVARSRLDAAQQVAAPGAVHVPLHHLLPQKVCTAAKTQSFKLLKRSGQVAASALRACQHAHDSFRQLGRQLPASLNSLETRERSATIRPGWMHESRRGLSPGTGLHSCRLTAVSHLTLLLPGAYKYINKITNTQLKRVF